MKQHLISILVIASCLSISILNCSTKNSPPSKSNQFLTKIVDLENDSLKLFWKNGNGKLIHSFKNLKEYVEKNDKELTFAMNAGMYHSNFSPVGLYIENGKILNPLNTKNDKGNFFMKPNGVFYITNNNLSKIQTTQDFQKSKPQNIKYATQSGPMLVIANDIHPKFNKTSTSKHFRNGVGLLPDGKLLFVMSKKKVNLYDFAMFFKNQGCKNALYLDGFVSKTYLPEKNWIEQDGKFGVIIGVTKSR